VKLSSIECIARALNNAEVSFLVVGGLAVVAHGYGRQTQDLDLVIRLDAPCINAAFAALARLGYHPRIPVTSQQMADIAELRQIHGGMK
jgi:hypothetical protein